MTKAEYEHMFVPPKNPRLVEKFGQARKLRLEGMPVRRIATALSVSQSSISIWTRDIELTREQRAINLKRAGEVRGAAWRKHHRHKRSIYQQTGRMRAHGGRPLHLAGCMLYWSEGSKGRNHLQFCNSDLAMVTYFKRFISECFGVEADRFTLTLNVYLGNGLSIEQIEGHWLDALGLPRSCLRKHQINHTPTSSSGKKVNKLPYGVCTLTVRRGTVILQHIYGAIQEYSGIDQPAWLDGPPLKPRKPRN